MGEMAYKEGRQGEKRREGGGGGKNGGEKRKSEKGRGGRGKRRERERREREGERKEGEKQGRGRGKERGGKGKGKEGGGTNGIILGKSRNIDLFHSDKFASIGIHTKEYFTKCTGTQFSFSNLPASDEKFRRLGKGR